MRQRQILGTIWTVWQGQQFHAALAQQSIALARVAPLASRHHIRPIILPTP